MFLMGTVFLAHEELGESKIFQRGESSFAQKKDIAKIFHAHAARLTFQALRRLGPLVRLIPFFVVRTNALIAATAPPFSAANVALRTFLRSVPSTSTTAPFLIFNFLGSD